MTVFRCFVLLLLFSCSSFPLLAGGPVGSLGTTPTKYAANRFPLSYKTDRGNLGSFNNTQATQIALFAFTQWDDLATAALSLFHAGQLEYDVISATDPYISGIQQFSDGVFPVIFDTDGSITDARIGAGARQQVYGFASSFSDDGVNFEEGFVIISGFLTSRENIEPIYREVITHEVGHMLGLSHSQVGLHADYSLMYPTTQSEAATGLEPDDVAAMSNLYPAPGYLASVGAISGTVTNSSDGAMSGVNVIAVDSVTGNVYSTVSDYYSGDDGRFINKPTRTGGYSIQGLPPGKYFVRIEPINPLFVTGSQVSSYVTPINTEVWHEWYNGQGESGNMLLDNSGERVGVVVTAGGVTGDIDIVVNESPTLTTLVEHTGTASQEIPLPFQAGAGVTITRFATRYVAPTSGSLLGIRLWTQASSDMPENSSLTVTVYRDDVDGSIAGTPGQELGSVTVPFSELAGDQYNDIWLRGIGNRINFFQGQKFHVGVQVNGGGFLNCLLDDANGTENQTSYFVQEANRWLNLPDGLGTGAAGWNLFMSAIYTTIPSGVEAPLVEAPTQLSFGTKRMGVLATREVTIQNVGTADLNVTDVLIGGESSTYFSVVSGGGAFTVKPGEQRRVTVGFTPQTRTTAYAFLQILHNASGSPTRVNLSGAGSEPTITMVTSTIDFGERQLNLPFPQESTIFRNSGNDTLHITSVQIEGEGFTLLSPSGAASLGPIGSFKVRVTFRPTEEKTYSGMVRIYHDLPSSPTEIPLSGIGRKTVSGVSSQIAVSGLSLLLDPVQPNPARDLADIVWQVKGTGRLPVEIIVSDITGRILQREEREIVGTGGTVKEYLPLNVRDFPAGEYQVTVQSARGSATQKFVVIR